MQIPIVIEGQKWAGKTPLVKALSQKVDCKIVEPWQDAIKCFSINPYHLFIDKVRNKEIIDFLSNIILTAYSNYKDQLIIFDRHWLTLLTSFSLIDKKHSFYSEAKLQHIFEQLFKPKLFTVFLDCPLEIVLNRRTRKGNPPWNEKQDQKTRRNITNIFSDHINFFFDVNKPRVDLNKLSDNILKEYELFKKDTKLRSN